MLLFIIYYLLFIIYYLLFIIYYLLFIIYYLLFIYLKIFNKIIYNKIFKDEGGAFRNVALNIYINFHFGMWLILFFINFYL